MLSDQQIVELHASGLSVYQMARDHGVPSTSLHRRCVKLGLDTKSKSKIREEPVKGQEGLVLELFESGCSRGEIARRIGCNPSTVSRILKSQGQGGPVNNKTISFDESFYEVIDTEAKAYSLGFFTADGSNTGKVASIRITDRDVVEQIASAMRYDGLIRTVMPSERSRAKLPQHCLNVCSVKMCSDLARLDCPPNKSFVTRFPDADQVPQGLVRHYIRGVFDGDGSLYHTSNSWNICIAGTEALLAPMLGVLRLGAGVCVGGVYKHGNIKVLKIPGFRACTRVLGWLYEYSHIHMSRKFQIYKRMMGAGV